MRGAATARLSSPRTRRRRSRRSRAARASRPTARSPSRLWERVEPWGSERGPSRRLRAQCRGVLEPHGEQRHEVARGLDAVILEGVDGNAERSGDRLEQLGLDGADAALVMAHGPAVRPTASASCTCVMPVRLCGTALCSRLRTCALLLEYQTLTSYQRTQMYAILLTVRIRTFTLNL